MEPRFLAYKKSQISYRRSGSGPRLLLCFHGYGEDASRFDFFATYTGQAFTFLAIDLPFHGHTDWQEGLCFEPAELQEIIRLLLKQESLPQPIYSLAGYSLGGRVSLSLYQLQPENIDKIILLAPDGLRMNFWYWLATQTVAGNHFFRFTMHHPGWFFGLMKGLNKIGMINSSIFKFANYYIGDPDVREQLYTRWTTLRKFKPGLPAIKKQLKERGTILRMIYGLHDRIIRSERGRQFISGLEDQALLLEIHSGHQLLHEKHAKEILPALLH